MTCRAKHPDHLWPTAVGDAPPSPVTLFARLVRQVENSRLAAGFAAHRGVRIVPAETGQVAIRRLFRFSRTSVKAFALRVSFVPLPDHLRDARSATGVRARPLLVGRREGEELGATNLAFARLVGVLRQSRPSIRGTASVRAEAAVAPRVTIDLPALVTGPSLHLARPR